MSHSGLLPLRIRSIPQARSGPEIQPVFVVTHSLQNVQINPGLSGGADAGSSLGVCAECLMIEERGSDAAARVWLLGSARARSVRTAAHEEPLLPLAAGVSACGIVSLPVPHAAL